MRPIEGAVRSTAASFRGMARTSETSMRATGQAATRAAAQIGQAGRQAGTAFGRGLSSSMMRSVDQAARQAQARLAAIRAPALTRDAGGRFMAGAGAAGPRDARGRFTRGAGLGSTFVAPPPTIGARMAQMRAIGTEPRAPLPIATRFAGLRRAGNVAERPAAFTPAPRGRLLPHPAPIPGATATPRRQPPAPSGARGRGEQWGNDGIGRLWALSALGGQVRQGVDAARAQADRSLDVTSERQTARAEMRTVVTDVDERAGVRAAARDAALGRGGMAVAVTETEFTNAVFGGVASGLTAEQAVNLVPAASNLALAGQATPQQAQIGLTQLSKFYPEREFADLGDAIAKAQDMFAFPAACSRLPRASAVPAPPRSRLA